MLRMSSDLTLDFTSGIYSIYPVCINFATVIFPIIKLFFIKPVSFLFIFGMHSFFFKIEIKLIYKSILWL